MLFMHVSLHYMQSFYKKTCNHLMSLPKSPILLSGIPFERVELFKYLGLVISSDLSWSNHILTNLHRPGLVKRILGLLYRQYTTTMLRGMSSNNFICHLSDHTWNTVVHVQGRI